MLLLARGMAVPQHREGRKPIIIGIILPTVLLITIMTMIMATGSTSLIMKDTIFYMAA